MNRIRCRMLVCVALATLGATGPVFSAQSGPSANALLAVDQNRATVVDRIVAEWGTPLAQSNAGLSADQLRAMLGGLRADHLLAASLAGSLSGLRDVIANAMSAPDRKPGFVPTKSTGDVGDDVVYTPVTPCRLVETRSAYMAVYHGAGPFAGGTIRDYVVQGGNGVCVSQLPAGLGAAAVQLQVFGIPINGGSSGDVEILPQGSTFGNTSTEVYVGNVLINTVSTVAKINTSNNTISVQVRGGGADLAIDIVGYFKAPANFGGTTIVSGHNATVGGGYSNSATGNDSTVAGGNSNSASSTGPNGNSAVGGGFNNLAGADFSTIAGGNGNTIQSTGMYGAIAGGNSNRITGLYAAVPGGLGNTADGYGSFAAGSSAHAVHDGCFVWGDATGVTGGVSCLASNQVAMRAYGGFLFITGASGGYIGAQLLPGAGAWTAFSDRNGKNNFRAVDAKAVLRKVAAMPIATWNWKSQDATIRHMGPMAQDFHQAFGLGETPLGISTVDADGVALAAIQGLDQVMKGLRLANVELRHSLKQKDERISAMQRQLDAINTKLGIN